MSEKEFLIALQVIRHIFLSWNKMHPIFHMSSSGAASFRSPPALLVSFYQHLKEREVVYKSSQCNVQNLKKKHLEHSSFFT